MVHFINEPVQVIISSNIAELKENYGEFYTKKILLWSPSITDGKAEKNSLLHKSNAATLI